MDFFLVFQKVVVIFLLIMVGYFVVKKGIVSPSGQKDVTNLLLYVFLPCTLLRTFQTPFEYTPFINGLQITFTMAVIYLSTTALSIFIARLLTKDPQKRAILVLGMVLPNVAFMGYPIIEAIIGQEYIFYAVMGTIAFETISWTIMVSLITKSTDIDSGETLLQRLIRTPAIVTIVISFIMYISPFRIPEPFISTINLLSNAMSPVAMIIVGMALSKADLKKVLLQKDPYIVSAIRLLVYPLMVLGLFRLIGISGITYSMPLILVSMPSAGYTSILAGKYGSDATYASEIVTMCTLLSLVTIPFVLSLL